MFKRWIAIAVGCLMVLGSGAAMAGSSSHGENTALLVLDLQVDFLQSDGRMPIAADEAGPVIANSNRAIATASAARLAIVYVGNEYTRWDIPGNWFRHNAARTGTPGAVLDPRLDRIPGAPYFSKHKGDAFSNPALEAWLRAHHVGRVVICGVYAAACVTATARGAMRRGFAVTILSDAVGAKSDAARGAAVATLARAGMRVETADAFIAGVPPGTEPIARLAH